MSEDIYIVEAREEKLKALLREWLQLWNGEVEELDFAKLEEQANDLTKRTEEVLND